ncbi:hypothetical protein HDU77_006946 [Chytriomyces hyalinus]|nr:hypothetical protein HDU77_006946 [Chytriomyces hyalinus]
MNCEFTQLMSTGLITALENPIQIVSLIAIVGLGLLVSVMGMFALGLGLGLTLSQRHLQQEVTSFKQVLPCFEQLGHRFCHGPVSDMQWDIEALYDGLVCNLILKPASLCLSCCVHYKVDRTDSCMPGTEIAWSTLIQDALVFPYLDGCYVIPMSLIWNVNAGSLSFMARKKHDAKELCECKVANLKIEDLFTSYEHLCSLDLYHLGMAYESLFVTSLAVKYYLRSVEFVSPAIAFVNFSEGIDTPDVEKTTGFPERAITHHKKIRTVHHDMIIPVKSENECFTATTTTSATTLIAVKPSTPTSKSTYTPNKVTLAAAAILSLISRGSAGNSPFTPMKLDKTPTTTSSQTIMHGSLSKTLLPSPDIQERAFFAEEKYFAKLPFLKAIHLPPVCRPCDNVALHACAKVVQELKAQFKIAPQAALIVLSFYEHYIYLFKLLHGQVRSSSSVIIFPVAIFGLGLLLASIGIFALGLALSLALSQRYLQQQVTSLMQGNSCPASNDPVTHQRDALHVEVTTLTCIISFTAIIRLSLLVNATAIFAIGLALYCSHCHLQHEIASLKQETPKSSNLLLETVTHEQDALHTKLTALRRSSFWGVIAFLDNPIMPQPLSQQTVDELPPKVFKIFIGIFASAICITHGFFVEAIDWDLVADKSPIFAKYAVTPPKMQFLWDEYLRTRTREERHQCCAGPLSRVARFLNAVDGIIYFAAIVGLGLLINAIGIFSIGLALYCSHFHLQHEIASLKQETPDLSNSLLETVTRERDALRAELAALRRSTHGPLPIGASDAISRGPSPISPSTPVINVPSATPPSVALQLTAQPTTQPAATILLTPSFTNTPTDKPNLTELTVAPTTPVITPQPVNQVALAAEARFGLINRPASAASAQSANTLPSPAFIATPATKSNTTLSTTAQPTSQPAATAPITPSVTHTPTHKSNATPTDATIPIATTSTPATNTTPHTVPQVALAAETRFGLINRPASAAGAQSATTTQSPPTLTATPASTSTTSITNINSAAGATRALIKRAPAAISPSTPTPLPRPVATPFVTPITLTTKPSPANLTPSRLPRLTSPRSNKPSPLGRSWVTAPSTPSPSTPAQPLNAKPTTVKPTTPTSKSTYTPDKATLAAAAILGLISRGSAGKGPFTPTKIPGLDKTPTKTPIATPTRTQANLTPTKMPLPSPDCYERAFFAEEKYFAKLPFPKTFRPDLKNPQF